MKETVRARITTKAGASALVDIPVKDGREPFAFLAAFIAHDLGHDWRAAADEAMKLRYRPTPEYLQERKAR